MAEEAKAEEPKKRSRLRWVLGWVLAPGLILGTIFGGGSVVGANLPNSWFTRAVLWVAGRSPSPIFDPGCGGDVDANIRMLRSGIHQGTFDTTLREPGKEPTRMTIGVSFPRDAPTTCSPGGEARIVMTGGTLTLKSEDGQFNESVHTVAVHGGDTHLEALVSAADLKGTFYAASRSHAKTPFMLIHYYGKSGRIQIVDRSELGTNKAPNAVDAGEWTADHTTGFSEIRWGATAPPGTVGPYGGVTLGPDQACGSITPEVWREKLERVGDAASIEVAALDEDGWPTVPIEAEIRRYFPEGVSIYCLAKPAVVMRGGTIEVRQVGGDVFATADAIAYTDGNTARMLGVGASFKAPLAVPEWADAADDAVMVMDRGRFGIIAAKDAAAFEQQLHSVPMIPFARWIRDGSSFVGR